MHMDSEEVPEEVEAIGARRVWRCEFRRCGGRGGRKKSGLDELSI
jgi:hypothetical protein